MFISDSHLPQVLGPPAYCSREHHQRELEKLFLPAWHLVGTLAELPGEGDYFTQEILGYPLIIWRIGGRVHAFLNVCAHRSCKLTHAACGHGERLRCQYHGWEYDETGNTRKIPDARSFRPMKPGVVGLREFRCETVGQLIFVSLSNDGPDLAEFLGPAHQLCKEVFDGKDWEFLGVGDRQVAANWKTYIENTIETYHVETVHPTTLCVIPDEKTCRHEIDERWSLLRTFGKPGHLNLMDQVAHRVLGVERDPDYHNLLIYPHLVIGKMSLFSWADQVLPAGPGTMRVLARGFSHTGRHSRWRTGLVRYLVRRWGRKFMQQIVAEDAAVLEDVQKGLESPVQPPGGLISIREERIYHFQQYIRRTTGGSSANARQPGAEKAAENAVPAAYPLASPSIESGLWENYPGPPFDGGGVSR